MGTITIILKKNKQQIVETTVNNYANNGGYLLQQWKIESDDKKNDGKKQNIMKSTKTFRPTGHSGATAPSAIGHSFMHLEKS